MAVLNESHRDWVPRYRGALLGLAAGDALGTTVEFQPLGSFPPLTDMVGGGPFHLEAGQWTDDTSMALCLAESLVERGGFDPFDQLDRYTRWKETGHLSSNGKCFDIGITVSSALRTYRETRDPHSGPTDTQSAGNGSIMRLAPVALFYAGVPHQALHWAGESSRTTHGTAEAVDGCRYLAGLLVGAVRGVPKEKLLAPGYSPVPGAWQGRPLAPAIAEVAGGSFKRRSPPDIKGTGYVVASLEAALWALHHSTSFEEGCLRAVNLGNDADTTGAVYGQLAGAIYGEEGVPARWREKLARRGEIEDFAERLWRRATAAQGASAPTAPAKDPARPIDDSYWVQPGRLAAGEYPGAPKEAKARAKVRDLLQAGVTLFVDLTDDQDRLEPYEELLREEAVSLGGRPVKYHRRPIPDLSVPDEANMIATLDLVDQSLAAGEVVYVHCWGGIGRTGTVVGCHLVRHGTEGSAALEQIAKWRLGTPDGARRSPETKDQCDMVRRWSKGR